MSLFKNLSKVSVYSVYKKYQFNKLKKAGHKIIQTYLNNKKIIKLHIGAGESIIEGWLNVDLEPLDKRIAYLDAASVYPIKDNVVDFVYSEHLFEHLNLNQQIIMLKEVYRVLKPGGKIRIASPNLDVILSIKDNTSKAMDEYISWSASAYFPNQIKLLGEGAKSDVFVINNYFHNWGHQFIHNPGSLQLLLDNAGFKKIQQLEIYKSPSLELQNLETHGNVIPPDYNKLETMIFEAVKEVI